MAGWQIPKSQPFFASKTNGPGQGGACGVALHRGRAHATSAGGRDAIEDRPGHAGLGDVCWGPKMEKGGHSKYKNKDVGKKTWQQQQQQQQQQQITHWAMIIKDGTRKQNEKHIFLHIWAIDGNRFSSSRIVISGLKPWRLQKDPRCSEASRGRTFEFNRMCMVELFFWIFAGFCGCNWNRSPCS